MDDDELLDRYVRVEATLPKAVAEEVKRRFLVLRDQNEKLRREADKTHFMRENLKALQCDLGIMQEFVSRTLDAVPNEFLRQSAEPA